MDSLYFEPRDTDPGPGDIHLLVSSVQVQESELESTDLEISSTPPTDGSLVSRDKTPGLLPERLGQERGCGAGGKWAGVM